jgi:hypothetical protein
MYDFAFNAHSGLRYLVLLLGVLAALYALVGMMRKRPVDNAGMTLLRVWTVLLDIQFLLGVLTLIALIMEGRFTGQLIGHLVLMVAAIAVAHLGAIKLKKADPATRSYGAMLATSLIPLLVIIGGILAIGRPIV